MTDLYLGSRAKQGSDVGSYSNAELPPRRVNSIAESRKLRTPNSERFREQESVREREGSPATAGKLSTRLGSGSAERRN